MGQSVDRIQASRTNGESLMAMPNGSRGNKSLNWLVERSKHFGALQGALDWIQEKKYNVENAPFGENRKCKPLDNKTQIVPCFTGERFSFSYTSINL